MFGNSKEYLHMSITRLMLSCVMLLAENIVNTGIIVIWVILNYIHSWYNMDIVGGVYSTKGDFTEILVR
jgi:hypothetical protein